MLIPLAEKRRQQWENDVTRIQKPHLEAISPSHVNSLVRSERRRQNTMLEDLDLSFSIPPLSASQTIIRAKDSALAGSVPG
jgi:hypothetical protein